MCCNLAESFGSREHWLWDIARKRNKFLLFSIVLRILQLLITLEPLDWFRWGFQQNVPLQMNRKCHMFEFWLISLDRITYCKFATPYFFETPGKIPYNYGTFFHSMSCIVCKYICEVIKRNESYVGNIDFEI